MVADLSLNKPMLQDVLQKNSKTCREARCRALSARTLSSKRTQELCDIANQLGMASEVANQRRTDLLRTRIKDIASVRKRYVYRLIHVLLLREGWKINHKRVCRLYRQEALNLRKPSAERKSASQGLLRRAWHLR